VSALKPGFGHVPDLINMGVSILCKKESVAEITICRKLLSRTEI
jgi:hypothetical protein